MDFDSIFPFNENFDTYNGDVEPMTGDDNYRIELNRNYKERFLSNKEGQRKYTAIIKKQLVYQHKPADI